VPVRALQQLFEHSCELYEVGPEANACTGYQNAVEQRGASNLPVSTSSIAHLPQCPHKVMILTTAAGSKSIRWTPGNGREVGNGE
jgi:hypothetical protein